MPDAALGARVGDILGKRPRSRRLVGGGYTPAERWVMSFDDGSSCFVKAATDDGTAAALRREYAVYSAAAGILHSSAARVGGQRRNAGSHRGGFERSSVAATMDRATGRERT
jgi:hypothetical protein